MKYTGAIFDFNGTLLFDSEYHNLAWNKLSLELRDIGLSKQEMNTKVHGVPNVEAIENLFHLKFSKEKKEELSKLKEKYYRDICLQQSEFKLVKGSIELFEFLKEQNIPFTIASASILENINFFYESFNLKNWILKENIIYDDGNYINKVEMFNDALNKIKTDKTNCLIFEDSISGVQNAIEAGFKNIIVLHYEKYNRDFDKFDQVIYHSNNFVDILSFLNHPE